MTCNIYLNFKGLNTLAQSVIGIQYSVFSITKTYLNIVCIFTCAMFSDINNIIWLSNDREIKQF